MDDVPIDFRDMKTAFAHRTTSELVRSVVVFAVCERQFLVEHSRTMLGWSQRLLGDGFTNWFLRKTFFGHFCAGENNEDIREVVNRLKAVGVNSILDYAAEADLVETTDIVEIEPEDDVEHTGRTLPFDIGEADCDANVDIFKTCIDAAAQFEHGFAAIKVTALGRPLLLERMTQVIRTVQDMFRQFDRDGSRDISYDEFCYGLDQLHIQMPEQERKELFDQFDTSGSGAIDFLEWTEYLKVEDLRTRVFFTQTESPVLPCLTRNEFEQCERMMGRLHLIADYAAERKVRLMVDAEQTYFQPAISHTVVNLQRKHNRERPTIFHTYQCYLRETEAQLKDDLERSRREEFLFAAKLVRGAYMVSERQRARELEYQDPIWPTILDTHACYHRCLDLVLDEIDRSNVMVASHNDNTCKYAVKRMGERGIDKKTGGVFFGQLLGMADHLSVTLGQHGYNAFKYVPYGPIKEVIPYLLRRAEENSALLGSPYAKLERDLVQAELKRRLGLRSS